MIEWIVDYQNIGNAHVKALTFMESARSTRRIDIATDRIVEDTQGGETTAEKRRTDDGELESSKGFSEGPF